MGWSTEVTNAFVELYLSYPCMWNPAHEAYREKYPRQDAARDIIQKFEALTGIKLLEYELRMKIKSLKSTYYQELNKIRSRAAVNKTFKPTLSWFAAWHKCFGKRNFGDDDDSAAVLKDSESLAEESWKSENHDEDSNSPEKNEYIDNYIKKPDKNNLIDEKLFERWNPQQTLAFVKLYLSHPCLWDTEHEDYKHKNTRLEACREIAKKFEVLTSIKMYVHQVRTKIRNLRSTYGQECKKIKQLSQKNKQYKPNLGWFQYMHECLNGGDVDLSFGVDSSFEIIPETTVSKAGTNSTIDNIEDPLNSEMNNSHAIIKTEANHNIYLYEDNNYEHYSSNTEPELDNEDNIMLIVNSENKNETKYKWNQSETHKFVKLYLKHPVLWDKRLVNYRNKRERMSAYSDIATKFKKLTGIQINDRTIALKVNNLRSTYSQELIKIKKRSSFYGKTFKSNLLWFDDWHKCFKKRNLYLKRFSSTTTSLSEESEPDTSADFGEAEGNELSFASVNSDVNEQLFVNDETEQIEDHDYHLKRKICRDSASNTDPVPTKLSRETEDDEFDAYGKYVASQLRSLDLAKAITTKAELQKILTEARLACLETDKQIT